jgi:hypothetical protein
MPGVQCAVLRAHSSVSFWPRKLATQTLPSPSIATLQAPWRLGARYWALTVPFAAKRVALLSSSLATHRSPAESNAMPCGERILPQGTARSLVHPA